MKIYWQNEGMQPLGLPVYWASWCYHVPSLVCSSTASLLQSKGVLRTVKICLISISQSELVAHTFSWFWVHCWNMQYYFSSLVHLRLEMTSSNLLVRIISLLSFSHIVRNFSHKSSGLSGLLCFELSVRILVLSLFQWYRLKFSPLLDRLFFRYSFEVCIV